MNTKSLLLASVLATVAGTAMANNFDNAAELQVAQLSTSTVRSTMRAPTIESGYVARNDASPFAVSNTSDKRTRAEVRAETIKYLNSSEARAARSFYVGGAQ